MLHNFIFNGSLVSNTKKFSNGGGVGNKKEYKVEFYIDRDIDWSKGEYGKLIDTMYFDFIPSDNEISTLMNDKNSKFVAINQYEQRTGAYTKFAGYSLGNNIVKYSNGGGVGDELMGGQPNKSEKSGYKLLKVQHNGKIIVVTDNNGETKERWIKNENGVAGYSLRYNGNEYEFADSFNYANGGGIESEYRISGIVWYVTEESAGSDYDKIVGNVLTEDEFDEFFNDGKIEETRFNIKAKYDWQIRDKIYAEMAENDEERGLEYEKGRHIIGYKILLDNQDSGFDSDLPYEADENEGDYEYVNGGALSSDDKKNISEFIKTIENEVQSKNPIKKPRELFFGDSEVKYKLEWKQDEQDENMYSLRLLRFNDELKKYVEEDSMRDSMFIIYAKLEDYRDNFYKYANGGGIDSEGGKIVGKYKGYNIYDLGESSNKKYRYYMRDKNIYAPYKEAPIVANGNTIEMIKRDFDNQKFSNGGGVGSLTKIIQINTQSINEFLELLDEQGFKKPKFIKNVKEVEGKFPYPVNYAIYEVTAETPFQKELLTDFFHKYEFKNGGGVDMPFTFTKNDKVFTKGDISVQRVGGSDKWEVAIKGKPMGRVLGAQTSESAIKKAEKDFSNKLANGGGVAEGWTDDEMSDEKALYAGNKFVKGGGLKQKGKTDKAHDKVYKAKRVGYRYTDERAKKLGLSSNAKPTQEHIDKYLGNGVYKEDRANRSDKSRMKKLSGGGSAGNKGIMQKIQDEVKKLKAENPNMFKKHTDFVKKAASNLKSKGEL